MFDTRQVTDKDPIRHPFNLNAVHKTFRNLGLFNESTESGKYGAVFILAVPVGAKMGNTRFKLFDGDSVTFDKLQSGESHIGNAVRSKISSLLIVKIRFDSTTEAITS